MTRILANNASAQPLSCGYQGSHLVVLGHTVQGRGIGNRWYQEVSHFSRLSSSRSRIPNNTILDPLISLWVLSITRELDGWRWFLVCVGLACSSWPWLDPASLLTPHRLNVGASHITVPTPFQPLPRCLLVVLWNIVAPYTLHGTGKC